MGEQKKGDTLHFGLRVKAQRQEKAGSIEEPADTSVIVQLGGPERGIRMAGRWLALGLFGRALGVNLGFRGRAPEFGEEAGQSKAR